jgi:hypothetical protein
MLLSETSSNKVTKKTVTTHLQLKQTTGHANQQSHAWSYWVVQSVNWHHDMLTRQGQCGYNSNCRQGFVTKLVYILDHCCHNCR